MSKIIEDLKRILETLYDDIKFYPLHDKLQTELLIINKNVVWIVQDKQRICLNKTDINQILEELK